MVPGATRSELTLSERLILLQAARRAISRQAGEKFESIDEPNPTILEGSALTAIKGVFVSLHTKAGDLRGCVGSIRPALPLYRETEVVAVDASRADKRFKPVQTAELPNIVIEISVLSLFEPVIAHTQIEIGVHGLYLAKGPSRGLLLPQVAKKHEWTIPDFLNHISIKAGLPGDGWRDAHLQLFTAQVFNDRDLYE